MRVTALEALGDYLKAHGRRTEAADVYRPAGEVLRASAPDDPTRGANLHHFAMFLMDGKEYAAAETVLRENFAYDTKHPDPAYRVPLSLGDLNTVLRAQNKPEESGTEALAGVVAHASVVTKAKAAWDGHKVEVAAELYRQAVALDRKAVPTDRAELASDLSWLGTCLQRMSRYPEAELAYREAADLYRKAPRLPAPSGSIWIAGLPACWCGSGSSTRRSPCTPRASIMSPPSVTLPRLNASVL